jgi:F-type H+-transporting ATPase subunit a
MIFAQQVNPFDHVLDSPHWHFFPSLDVHLHLPEWLSKYKVLLILAALLVIAVFVPLGRRVRNGMPVRGPFWNAMETLLTFIRDDVAKPYIGRDADTYVPFLWTLFLFVLICNLLGMIPFLGSPTANISVTGALALITFCFIQGAAIMKMGVKHYLQSFVPHIEVPFGMGYLIIPMIVVIEVFGTIIRSCVLAIRLFANMFAGHLVLATLLLFIVMVQNTGPFLFWPITFSTVVGVTLLSLLELFVAFLQAFIFTFLASLFLGMALHPQH